MAYRPEAEIKLVFSYSATKPSANDFSNANRVGLTKIEMWPEKHDVKITRWQFIKGRWQEVKRWRKEA